MERSNY